MLQDILPVKFGTSSSGVYSGNSHSDGKNGNGNELHNLIVFFRSDCIGFTVEKIK